MFGRKSVSLQTSAVAKIDAPEIVEFGSAEWFQGLTEEDYQAFLAHLSSKTAMVFKVKRFIEAKDNSDIARMYQQVLTLAGEADRSSLENNQTICDVIFTNYSKSLVTLSQHGGTALFYNNIGYENHKAYVVNWKQKMMEIKTGGTIDLFSDLKLNNASTGLAKGTSYGVVNEKVATITARLADIIVENLEAEDQYFVEQISDSYLPQIVNAAMDMRNLRGAERDEAEKMFATQLDLIDQKLSGIIVDSSQRMLASVRNQTNFLTASLTGKAPAHELTMGKKS